MAVSTNPLGRQSADLLKTGKAKIYAKYEGEKRWRDLGNAEEVTISVDTDTTTVDTNEDDLPLPVKSFVTINNATISVTARNHNQSNEEFSLQGLYEDYTQPAQTNQTLILSDVELYDVFRFGANEDVENVSVGAVASDGTAFVLNTHYRVDSDGGAIQFIAWPDGFDPTTDDITVPWSADTYTTRQLGGFSISGGVLIKLWIRETAAGPRGNYYVHKARTTADGDQGVIQDGKDPLTRKYVLTLEQDESQPANYGLFTYRKHKGSL